MSFNNSSHFVVSEATFLSNETINIVNNGVTELQYLYSHVAQGATHDSKEQYEKPKCHPDTRNQVLGDIHEWIKVPDKEIGIMFLHGPAGAGKSCIARSVCEQAAAEGLLGGSFFFWRSSSVRNNERQLIATLAYQLAERNMELRQYVLSEISKNFRIFDMPIEVQFRKLILEPCKKVPRERLGIRAIVIDGLDECMGERVYNSGAQMQIDFQSLIWNQTQIGNQTQVSILQILARAVRFEKCPLGFFITSRPELHIQEALDTKNIIFATNIISLSSIPGVSQDIRIVLESGFIRIRNDPRFKRAFKSVFRPWPTPESIDKLVHRSSDQFIYAETVLKFVSNPDNNPAAQLDIVLGIRDSGGSSSLADLDFLYQEILSRSHNPQITIKVISYILAIKDLVSTNYYERKGLNFPRDITRAILHNQNRLLLVVEQLLELADGMAYSALNQLHSLISLKVGSESTRRHLEIDFYHKSFRDFITTYTRSTTFYVDLKDAHFEVAQSCLKFMEHPKYETEAQHVGWLYSSFHWYVHNEIASKKTHLSSISPALQIFFSGSSIWQLNFLKLNKALETLGLLDCSWQNTRITQAAVHNMQKYGLLTFDDLLHVVDDVRRALFTPVRYCANSRYNEEYQTYRTYGVAVFDKACTYPVWRGFLQSYKKDVKIKQLLLVHHHTTRTHYHERSIPESELCKLLQVLGQISDERERTAVTNERERSMVLSLYSDLSKQIDGFMNGSQLKEFLETSEFSGPFHCTAEDFSAVHTAIFFTGIWRNYKSSYWFWCSFDIAVVATDPLLACLKAEALEFYDSALLIKTVNLQVESYLFAFLRDTLMGRTKDVIIAWTRTFGKARRLYPENFEDTV